MTRRFTVIQGGRGPDPAEAAVEPRPAVAPLTVDLHTALAVDAATVAAWRALLVRENVDDPLQDPDYLLTAAQHQTAGLRVVFALVWDRPADAPPVLQGAAPLWITRPVLSRDRARLWCPPDRPEPFVLRAANVPVLEAVRTRLAGLDRPVQLDPGPPPSPWHGARRGPPARVQAPHRSVPAASLLGIRPAAYRPPTVEYVREPGSVRDAVERFLVLDAHTARRPILADPAEVTMVRVVSRLFARRRQISIELACHGNTLVAGTLHLGSGTGTVAWRHAAQA